MANRNRAGGVATDKLEQKAQRHIGEITISDELLLSWLQFDSGRILNIIAEPHFRRFKVYLEHPEMPECPENAMPFPTTPTYITTYHDCGHRTVKRELRAKS